MESPGREEHQNQGRRHTQQLLVSSFPNLIKSRVNPIDAGIACVMFSTQCPQTISSSVSVCLKILSKTETVSSVCSQWTCRAVGPPSSRHAVSVESQQVPVAGGAGRHSLLTTQLGPAGPLWTDRGLGTEATGGPGLGMAPALASTQYAWVRALMSSADVPWRLLEGDPAPQGLGLEKGEQSST